MPLTGLFLRFFGNTYPLSYPATDSSEFLTNNCGNPLSTDITDYYLAGTFPHNDTYVWFAFGMFLGTGSFAIRDVRMLLENSPSTPTETFYKSLHYSSNVQPGSCPNQYYYDGSICSLCDPSCNLCFGKSASECFGCNEGYSFNGTLCFSCPKNCSACSGPNPGQCSRCIDTYILQSDNTCSAEACVFPDTLMGAGAFKVCSSLCSPGYLIFNDTHGNITCMESCQPPYRKANSRYCILSPTSSASETKQITTLANTLSMVKTAVAIASASSSLINFSSPAALLVSALLNMMQYIKYMSINYPPRLQQMLDLQSLTGLLEAFLPPISMNIVNKFVNYPLPSNFEQFNLNSNFLISYWSSLISLLILVIVIILSCLFSYSTTRYALPHTICTKIRDIFKWNFSLILFTSYYGDIAFFSSLQFHTVPYTKFNSVASVVSFSICLLVNIITVLVFIRIISVLVALRRHRRELRARTQDSTDGNVDHAQMTYASTKFKEYQSLFDSLKPRLWVQQAYVPISVLRIYLSSLTIAYLFQYPTVQTIILTALSAVMLLYLLTKLPWKSRTDQAQCIIQEIMILVVNICTLTLAFMDRANYENTERRALIGDLIIWSNVGFVSLAILYATYQNILNFGQVLIRIRAWYSSRRVAIDNKVHTEPIERTVLYQSSAENRSSNLQNQTSSFITESSKLSMLQGDNISTNAQDSFAIQTMSIPDRPLFISPMNDKVDTLGDYNQRCIDLRNSVMKSFDESSSGSHLNGNVQVTEIDQRLPGKMKKTRKMDGRRNISSLSRGGEINFCGTNKFDYFK